MKNILVTLALLLVTIFSFAQDSDLRKTKTKGDLSEVTLYYEDGTIMQHGFYTEEGNLHGTWESYNMDGSPKCIASYNYGVKVGIWTYWKNHKMTKIEYDNNKIISITEVGKDDSIKKNF